MPLDRHEGGPDTLVPIFHARKPRFIGSVLLQTPIRDRQQSSGCRYLGAIGSLAPHNPLIVAPQPLIASYGWSYCLHDRPAQPLIALLCDPPRIALPSRGMHRGHQPRIATELLRRGKPLDLSHLLCHQNREELPQPRNRPEKGHSLIPLRELFDENPALLDSLPYRSQQGQLFIQKLPLGTG